MFFQNQTKPFRARNIDNYYLISNFIEIKKTIFKIKPNLIIDALGNNYLMKTWKLRSFFFENKFTTLIARRAHQPKIIYPKINLLNLYFSNPKFFIKSLNNFILKKFVKYYYKRVKPNYYISSCKKTDNYDVLDKKYYLYSYDYETYLKNKKIKKIIKKDYVLFIDENVVYHPDYFNSNHPEPPASEEEYYKSLENFFLFFQKKYKIKVVVALHPSTKKKLMKFFSKFESYYFITGELAKYAKLILIHSSTVKHLAAIYKKQMLFLTSNEITKTWFQNFIVQNSKLFNAKIHNINSLDINFKFNKIDQKKYSKFLYNYVIHPSYFKQKKNFVSIINEIINK